MALGKLKKNTKLNYNEKTSINIEYIIYYVFKFQFHIICFVIRKYNMW